MKNRTQSEIMVFPDTLSLPGEKSQNINRKCHILCVTLPYASLNGNYLNVTVRQMVKHISKLNGT